MGNRTSRVIQQGHPAQMNANGTFNWTGYDMIDLFMSLVKERVQYYQKMYKRLKLALTPQHKAILLNFHMRRKNKSKPLSIPRLPVRLLLQGRRTNRQEKMQGMHMTAQNIPRPLGISLMFMGAEGGLQRSNKKNMQDWERFRGEINA